MILTFQRVVHCVSCLRRFLLPVQPKESKAEICPDCRKDFKQ